MKKQSKKGGVVTTTSWKSALKRGPIRSGACLHLETRHETRDGIGRSATALMARLDALTDPGRVEDANMLAAWREKYANEITERTKKRWWRRLVKAAGEKMARGRPERGKTVRGKAA